MPRFRIFVVDADDNSNIRTEDIDVAEGESPENAIQLAEGEAVGNFSQLSTIQTLEDLQ